MRSIPLPVLAVAALATACGGTSSSTTTPSSGFTITISNLAFSPLNLAVPPGATVTVVNRDSMAHDVTSESAPNAFTPGAVAGVSFETGPFTGTKTFTVPASAPDGTVVPYYCNIHRSTMATPNAQITVRVGAQPPAMGGGGGGGGGGGY
jgi:plastocyanin